MQMDKVWEDVFGNRLEVGDEVAYASTAQYVAIGTIKRFATRMIVITPKKNSYPHTVNRYPTGVVKRVKETDNEVVRNWWD